MKITNLLQHIFTIGAFLTVMNYPAIALADISGGLLPIEEKSEEAADPLSQFEITRRIAEVAAERTALSLQLEQDTAAAGEHLAGVADKLEQIERQLKAQADLAERLSLQPRTRDEQASADVPSIHVLNALYEQLASTDSALREKRSHLNTAKEQLQNLESRAREAKVTLQESPEKLRPRNERNARLAELAARLLREQVNLATLELREAQQSATQSGSLEARIAELRASLASGVGESDDAPAMLLERDSALQRAKNSAERQLVTAELRLAAAKQRYAENPQAAADELAVIEALTAYRDVIGKQIALATAELERLVTQRDIWRHWNTLLRSSPSPEELEAWEALANNHLDDLQLTAALRQGQLSDLEIRRENLQARMTQLAETSRARAALQETGAAIDRLNAELVASERLLGADQRVTGRFLDDIETITGKVGLFGYLSRAAHFVRNLWSYEITTIDEAPFTVGSLTMGLLLFVVGLWASRLGAGGVGRFASQRLKLDAGAAQAMQTFSFYALLTGFTLLALRAVHFPLTAFAFLGGALAIGIGFGSQNVMNNFISGLILMLERPVRAQDVVEVDGSHGVIQKIGPRSTQIRSTDGRHIVVPNSFFLESNVINWTLSDELMRTRVSVGVSYGSPTRLVKKLIAEVIRDEPLALNTPAPNIIFDAFGDNSLNFDAYFWVEARSPMGVREVQSNIRFRIDDVLREHDIVIAFPQRDVHLDSSTPIEVRMVAAADPPPTDKTS